MKRLNFICIALIFTFSVNAQNNVAESYITNNEKGISIRSNIVYWAAAMPNLGIEYRSSKEYGFLINGGWCRWDWNDNNERYRIWQISPQVRKYLGVNFDSYIGAELYTGQYCLKDSDAGSQGNYMGGGIALGHQLYAAKNIYVDLGLSLGYLNLYNRENFERINGKDAFTHKRSNYGYWGLTGLSMTFVWKLK